MRFNMPVPDTAWCYYNNAESTFVSHVAIADQEKMVCTKCGTKLRMYSPWEDPANWGGMSRDDFDNTPKYVAK
jgi:hypothetical protein